ELRRDCAPWSMRGMPLNPPNQPYTGFFSLMISSQSSELQFSLITEVSRPHSRIETPVFFAVNMRWSSPASCLKASVGLHQGDRGVLSVTVPGANVLKPLNLYSDMPGSSSSLVGSPYSSWKASRTLPEPPVEMLPTSTQLISWFSTFIAARSFGDSSL